MKRGILFFALILFVIPFLGLVGAQVLTPGTGWTGATSVPSPNESPGQYGYDAQVIAHWDHVPWQDAEGTINLGVLAYHVSGIQKVSFSVNNGVWVDVTSPTLNPETKVDEYWAVLNENLFSTSGNVEVRAIAYPNVGTPRVLQGTSVIKHDSSMIVSVDPQNVLPDNVAYVTVTGNNGNNCLSQATACATILGAMNTIDVSGNLDGAEIHLGEGTWSLPSSSGFNTPTRFFTITSIAGTNRDNVIINSYASGAPTSKYKLSRLSLFRGANLYYPMGEIWIDNSKIYKPTPWTCGDGFYEGGDMLGYASPEGGNEYHAYYTDVYINNVGHGPSNLILGRNITAQTTNDGHASGTMTLIDYWMGSVIQDCSAHADYYQFYANHDDIIIKGGGNIPGGNPVARGLATSAWGVTNLVVDGINLNWNGAVFSLCGADLRNIIIKNSYFANQGDWCFEWAGTPFNLATMSNILLQDSIFNFGGAFSYPTNPLTGQLPPTPPVTYSVTSTTMPNTPSGLIANILGSSSIRINWTDNSNNENGFTLQYKLSSSSTWIDINLGPNVKTYDQTGLVASTTYNYRVRAYNNVGVSTFSNTVSATTSIAPGFNFSILTNPNSGSVQRGSSVTTNINVNLLTGSPALVNLTASNLSSGLTATFNPTSCLPSTSCSITMILNANSSAQLVTNRKIIVIGTSGTIVRNITYNLTVTSTPVCTNGFTQLCVLQQGVCQNSQETCTNANWPGCNYTSIGNYQSTETVCDSLDNDCEGIIDEGCSVEQSSNGGSSSSGSSGSGGSSTGGSNSNSNSGISPILKQCNDNLDNDGDGLIDYPADLGCLNSNDNIELNENILGANQTEEEPEQLGGEESQNNTIGFIFWMMLIVLVIGIAIVGIIIAHNIYKRKKFQEYVDTIVKK